MKYFITLLLIFSLTPNLALALDLPFGEDLGYYRIGGAATAPRPVSISNTIVVGGSFSAGFGYSCGSFNPYENVQAMINQIQATIRRLPQQFMAALSGYVASLPGYLLNKANPRLYNVITKNLDDAFSLFETSFKSCQQIEREIAAGQNPYHDLIRASIGNKWQVTAGVGQNSGLTIDEVEAEVHREGPRDGVRWVGGNRRGGIGQPPAQINKDVSIAGYNALIGRKPVDDDSAPPGAQPGDDHAELLRMWRSPADAATWLIDTVGETAFTFEERGRNVSASGVGLRPWVSRLELEIDQALRKAVYDHDLDDFRELVSHPLGSRLLRTVREQDEAFRDTIIARLAGEFSVLETSNRVGTMRRIMFAGLNEVDLQSSEAADIVRDVVLNVTIASLDSALQEVQSDQVLRRTAVAPTLEAVIQEGRTVNVPGPFTRPQNKAPRINGTVHQTTP